VTEWHRRPGEERALLNPAFCSVLIWHAAAGYTAATEKAMPVELAFLVLPIVLHRESRETLPSAVSTSLAVWLDEHPLLRARFPERARTMVAFSRECLLFGGVHNLLQFEGNIVNARDERRKSIGEVMKESTDEVRACAKKAGFVGRWFAKAGGPATVMFLLGVRP